MLPNLGSGSAFNSAETSSKRGSGTFTERSLNQA